MLYGARRDQLRVLTELNENVVYMQLNVVRSLAYHRLSFVINLIAIPPSKRNRNEDTALLLPLICDIFLSLVSFEAFTVRCHASRLIAKHNLTFPLTDTIAYYCRKLYGIPNIICCKSTSKVGPKDRYFLTTFIQQ